MRSGSRSGGLTSATPFVRQVSVNSFAWTLRPNTPASPLEQAQVGEEADGSLASAGLAVEEQSVARPSGFGVDTLSRSDMLVL